MVLYLCDVFFSTWVAHLFHAPILGVIFYEATKEITVLALRAYVVFFCEAIRIM